MRSLEIDAQIEKGYPLPYIRGTYKDIWNRMDEGDSFKVSSVTRRNAAIMGGKRAGHEVTSQKINGCGWRVWLVKKGAGNLTPRLRLQHGVKVEQLLNSLVTDPRT